MKQIVIYPGRFQPMLKHHAEVYDRLQAKFPEADVYVGTSDKVDGDKSPFNFKEKQIIAQGHGLDANNVKFAKSPYVNTFYDSIEDQDNVSVIFAVGEKDKDRFPMDNLDPETGLDMTIRPDKVTGKPRPKYYQMINTYNKDNPEPMSKRGYIYYVPNIPSEDDEIASASAFRNALKNAPDEQSAKEIFSKQFKDYNESLFNLIYNKIAGNKMNEDLNLLRQLAGLEVSEDAPVEFETPLSIKDVKFTPPSKSSAFMSIANRFPEGADVNDPDVKKEEFIKVLLKAPLSLLSEINERISPADDNGLAISTKLSSVIDNLGRDGDLKDLSDDDRAFTIKIVKLAIDKMDLHAGDDSPTYDELEGNTESIDLSDIRESYGINERDICHSKDHDCATKVIHPKWGEGKPMYESHAVPTDEGYVAWYDVEFEHGIEKEVPAEDMEIITLAEHGSSLKASKFKPHMMYDPKTGEGKMAKVEQDHLDMKAKGWGHEKPKKEESVEEGRMSDIHQDANTMDKEEFAKEHPMFANDWEGMQNDPDAEDEPRDDGSPAYKKYIGKNKKDESLESYNFIEEAEKSIEDCIRKTLEKEGGAAGKGALVDACKEAGYSEEECNDAMSKMSDVKQHEHGDYILEAKNCGCGQTPCKTYGKQDEGVEESSEDSGEGSIRDMDDDELMDYVGQKEEDLIDDIQDHISPDFLHKDNYEEMFEKYREDVLEPAAMELSQEKAMDQMPDEMEMDYEESIDNASNNAFEAAMDELKKLAGL